jgi:hypothetical protein
MNKEQGMSNNEVKAVHSSLKNPCSLIIILVGCAGLEPATLTLST